MLKRNWLPLAGVALVCAMGTPSLSQLPSAAPTAPTAPPDDAYERARQKLRETIQNAPPPPAELVTPATASAGGAPAVGGAATVDASGAAAAQLALVDLADLPPSMRSLDDKQKLSPSDRLSFKVTEDREEAKPIMVTDSGEVEIPYIGRLKAQDKTCLQIAREAKALLEKDYYHKATVLVNVDALSRTRGRVYLYGFVRTPGPAEIPADEKMTVGKIILRAGGFADFANKRKVTLTRKSSNDSQGNQIFEIDMIEVLEKGRQERDMEVRPDDMIWVPQRVFNF